MAPTTSSSTKKKSNTKKDSTTTSGVAARHGTTTGKSNMMENYESWTAHDFANYLKTQHNLGDYYEMIIQHGITGKVAPTLTEQDLKEMGVSTIGDRKRLQAAISEMTKHARKKQREEVVWEDDEQLWFSWWDACCTTCCGCCPRDAAHYTLSGTHLTIKTEKPTRCGPIMCCCGHEYVIDNVDLTHVVDADVRGVAPPCCQKVCCCGKTRDYVTVKTSVDGTKTLVLRKGQGEPTSRIIMNQVEEAQQMERD